MAVHGIRRVATHDKVGVGAGAQGVRERGPALGSDVACRYRAPHVIYQRR